MPGDHYRARLAHWGQQLAQTKATDERLSQVRGFLALATVVLAFFTFSLWLAAPVALFAVLVILHERNAKREKHARRAIALAELGLARVEGAWAGKGSAGARFADAGHPYSSDLDLFGAGGLFELVSTARTEAGEAVLAAWLLEPASRDEALARQQAVRELTPRADLREELALLGEEIRAALHAEAVAKWGRAPEVKAFAGARWILLAVSAPVLVAFVGWLAQQWTLRPLLGLMLVVIPLALAMRRTVALALAGFEARARDLALLTGLTARLERESFQAPKLRALHDALASGGGRASEQIHRLRRLLEWLDSDRNAIFAIPAFCMLWRPQFALAIERWRRQNGPHLGTWLKALAEFEALASLSGYAFEHPAAVYPELSDEEGEFVATSLAHPLIAEAKAVANDVSLGGPRRLLIISGSNMSGKSTLLRAVGLNTVLAWAGAPVRAKSLRVSAFQVAASLRTNDSLQEGRSRFYAEIQRLRQIVDLTAGPRRVLFLIDEVLSGTNSHDRRIGAEAILKGLLARGARGFTTTHDLALTRMLDQAGAENWHLQDELVDGQLHFDYRLRPGVVERSNALDLMRSIGLDV